MAWNQELDRLKTAQQAAYERKQAAWQAYDEARKRTQEVYDAMQEAWQERQDAKTEMNREYEARQAAFERNDVIWDEYKRIRDRNNYQLEYLRRDADTEHQAMISCFEEANAAYENGDRASAALYSSEGHDHKDRRNSLNDEVSTLVQEIRDAKAYAESAAPKVDSSAFYAAKSRFEAAKAKHQAKDADFKREKAERNRAKAEFERLQQEFLQAKEAFQRKRDEVRSEKQARQDEASRIITSATGRFAGKAAKVRKRQDGRTDIFFSSGEHGDDFGHGHVVVDQNGSIRYARDEWQDKHTEYLIDDTKEDHTRI